jgi:hypothetical protein
MLVCTDRLVKAGKVVAGKFGALMTDESSPRRPGIPQLFRERSQEFRERNASGQTQHILTIGRRVALSTECGPGWLGASFAAFAWRRKSTMSNRSPATMDLNRRREEDKAAREGEGGRGR